WTAKASAGSRLAIESVVPMITTFSPEDPPSVVVVSPTVVVESLAVVVVVSLSLVQAARTSADTANTASKRFRFTVPPTLSCCRRQPIHPTPFPENEIQGEMHPRDPGRGRSYTPNQEVPRCLQNPGHASTASPSAPTRPSMRRRPSVAP